MRTIILADGTLVNNCSDSSTVNEILAVRSTYEAAGAVRDLFTDENSTSIRIEDGEGTVIDSAGSLKLLPDASLIATEGGVICDIKLRNKTEIEILQDQISELQEAIIEE